jgi:hypothetical protein
MIESDFDDWLSEQDLEQEDLTDEQIEELYEEFEDQQ